MVLTVQYTFDKEEDQTVIQIQTTMWRATEEERDRLHQKMNRDKTVRTAKRVNR